MTINTELEIEILSPDKHWEDIEEMDDYGTVRVYNGEVGQFVPGYGKETVDADKWLESL
jgi:hypothetical protein